MKDDWVYAYYIDGSGQFQCKRIDGYKLKRGATFSSEADIMCGYPEHIAIAPSSIVGRPEGDKIKDSIKSLARR